jgi:lysozyme
MKVSRKGLESIKRHEGSRNRMYKDPVGLPTIGVGHLLTRSELTSGKIVISSQVVHWREGLTDRQVTDLLAQDIHKFEEAVNKSILVTLNQNQFDALVSLAFNIGEGAFQKSTLLRKLNAKDFGGAADQFLRWIYSAGRKLPGLVTRRKEERALFLSAPKEQPVEPPPPPVEANGPAPEPPVSEAPTSTPETPPMPKDDSSKKSLWATIVGGAGAVISSVGGFLTSTEGLIIIAAIGFFGIVVLFMFRQIIMGWLRTKLNADPTKHNVS